MGREAGELVHRTEDFCLQAPVHMLQVLAPALGSASRRPGLSLHIGSSCYTHLVFLPKSRLPGETGQRMRPVFPVSILFALQGPSRSEGSGSGRPRAKAKKKN